MTYENHTSDQYQASFETEVAIVGTGIAGALLAYELGRKGISVICLEAGPEIERAAILKKFTELPNRDFSEPYTNSAHAPFPSGKADDPYLENTGEHEYNVSYIRGMGGTTWHWAGHAWRFLAEDFREKSTFGVGRDMPIQYAELEPYYEKAEILMGVAGTSHPLDFYGVKRKNPFPLPAVPLSYLDNYVDQKIRALGLSVKSAPSARNTQVYDQRPPCCGSNNCMPICPIGAQYSASVHLEKARQMKNVKVLANSVVDRIQTQDHKTIESLRFRNPQGESFRVKARYYVLAAGGIEIPKLMLMSEIGNDQVGRNLMDHPLMFVSFLAAEDVFAGRGPMVIGAITEHQTGPSRREHAGFKINLKNFLYMQNIVDQQIDAGYLGTLLQEKIDQNARRLIGMEIFLGQLPDPNNRVLLSSTRRDGLGLPHPRIDYRVGTWTENAVKPAHDVCESIARACGMESDSLSFDSLKMAPRKRFNSNNHIMGTTIMGSNPKNSVTDKMGQVFSGKTDEPFDNLFISSSGLLGATGVNNVSLTIAALSLRLAEHLTHLCIVE
jgi:choline dehydrogenase-like flavoprotein